MPLKQWAARKNRELHRKALEDRDSHLWHSPSYHRYFEGYHEMERVDERGHRRLVREYVGVHYRQQLSRRAYVLLRAAYLVLLAVMIGMVVLAGGQQGIGKAFYVVLPELATVCLLAWTAYCLLVNYVPAPRKMTINDYRVSSTLLKRLSLCTFIAFMADAAMTVLELLLTPGAASVGTTLAAFAIGALAAAGLRCVEVRVPYAIENPPSDSGDKWFA